jgi:hypothetical protein
MIHKHSAAMERGSSANQHHAKAQALAGIFQPRLTQVPGEQRSTGGFIDTATASASMEEFFTTDFEGGRHQARIDKIPVCK